MSLESFEDSEIVNMILGGNKIWPAPFPEKITLK
jgi:hypothetical protein